MIKSLPVMQETWIQSLSREDTLEKEMATHSSILAWRIPWTEEPGGLYSPWGRRDAAEEMTSVGKTSCSGCRGHVPGPERGRWEVRASPANSHKEIKPQFYKELDSADTWKLPEPLTRAQPATP